MADRYREEAIGEEVSAPELRHIADEAANKLDIVVQDFCGKGAFKETFRVQTRDGRVAALKIVDRAKISEIRTDREIEALRRCETPRIAKLIDRYTHMATDGHIYDVVLEEFLDGGSLEDRLASESFGEAAVVTLAIGLVMAVKELHRLNLVHRDIKPANVMFRADSNDPVLVDFGLVRDLSQTSLTLSWLPHGPGTPFYAPPEQLNNDKALIDWRSDQFSIGVLATEMLTSRHPYQGATMNSSEAIYAVSERRNLAPEFLDEMRARNLLMFIKMVRPWPVQRFANPDLLLAELRKLVA